MEAAVTVGIGRRQARALRVAGLAALGVHMAHDPQSANQAACPASHSAGGRPAAARRAPGGEASIAASQRRLRLRASISASDSQSTPALRAATGSSTAGGISACRCSQSPTRPLRIA